MVGSGPVPALGVFLGQEILRFNRLLALMQSSLVDLQRAIKGLVVMSGQLDEVFGAIMYGKVPPLWATAAYPSLKPLSSWYRDLLDRLSMAKEWLVSGPPDSF